MARLFFALWPPDAARSELARLAAEVADRSGGRPVAASKVHLTLAFLGEVPAERAAAAIAAAQGVEGAGFSATFDQLGSFPRAGVAWAGPSRPPPELRHLADGLASRLRDAGFALDDRPFAAHVTLARRITRRIEAAAMAPVEWEAKSFALVESDRRTGRYTTRESWVLGAR
jgi:2'-5' RNA ligase